MAGTKEGGLKAAAKNKALHGADFYKRIGAKGGKNGTTGGFASALPCECSYSPWPHKKAECAGYKGGRISRRGKTKKTGVEHVA